MSITITAFQRSPDQGRGLARDTRVRWALEEVGQPYQVRYLSFDEMKGVTYLEQHPFGQIPIYQEGELTLFETGAIVLHISESYGGLLPVDVNARARAIAWMFAALNTVEVPILDLAIAKFVEGGEPWAAERLPLVRERIHHRLRQLANYMGGREWLDTAFSVGDLVMVHVLLRLKPSGLLNDHPDLACYVARGEARPAYQRAFAAQLAAFNSAPPSV